MKGSSSTSPASDRRDHRGGGDEQHDEGVVSHNVPGGGRRYENLRKGEGPGSHHPPPQQQVHPMPGQAQQQQHYPVRNPEVGYTRREPPMHHQQQQQQQQHEHHPGGGKYSAGGQQSRGMSNPGHFNRFIGPPGPARQAPPQQLGGGGPAQERPYENKKDKFPNYLHHIAPEDDPLATRNLFVGNLEVNITEEELRRIFGRFGSVEDIDIKRPPPGTGNAYAFVRFLNLDMASRAKTELSGQYIGKFQCKIGYGKVNPTSRVWVGGLGPWASLAQLEREFGRFGPIKELSWANDDPACYLTFETLDSAQAAVKGMRGYPLGGPERRLRTDFADAAAAGVFNNNSNNNNSNPPPKKYGDDDSEYAEGSSPGSATGSQQGAGDFDWKNNNNNNNNYNNPPLQQKQALSPPPPPSGDLTDIIHSESRGGTMRPCSNDNIEGSNNLVPGANKTMTLPEAPAARPRPVGWQGSLILKNSSFPSKMSLVSGDLDAVQSLLKDEEDNSLLRITQRLRLDQSKLDDVRKRMTTSLAHGVFLAVSTPIPSPRSVENASTGIQSRPLRNLVSYLKQKEAAGVISLAAKEANGVLYAFPPCPFSTELLARGCCPADMEPPPKEEYLVVVVIRGGGPA